MPNVLDESQISDVEVIPAAQPQLQDVEVIPAPASTQPELQDVEHVDLLDPKNLKGFIEAKKTGALSEPSGWEKFWSAGKAVVSGAGDLAKELATVAGDPENTGIDESMAKGRRAKALAVQTASDAVTGAGMITAMAKENLAAAGAEGLRRWGMAGDSVGRQEVKGGAFTPSIAQDQKSQEFDARLEQDKRRTLRDLEGLANDTLAVADVQNGFAGPWGRGPLATAAAPQNEQFRSAANFASMIADPSNAAPIGAALAGRIAVRASRLGLRLGAAETAAAIEAVATKPPPIGAIRSAGDKMIAAQEALARLGNPETWGPAEKDLAATYTRQISDSRDLLLTQKSQLQLHAADMLSAAGEVTQAVGRTTQRLGEKMGAGIQKVFGSSEEGAKLAERAAESTVKVSPKWLDATGRVIEARGKNLSAAAEIIGGMERSTPFFQQLEKATTGMERSAAERLRRVEFVAGIARQAAEVASGAIGGALEAGALGLAVGDPASFAGVGAVGGFFGSGLRVINLERDPAIVRARQLGDIEAARDRRTVTQQKLFDEAPAAVQLAAATFEAANPDLTVEFQRLGGKGGRYADGNVLVDLDSSVPLAPLMAHEVAHHLGTNEFVATQLRNEFLGDQLTGRPGLFTKVDARGKPVVDMQGRMKLTDEFTAFRDEYLAALDAAGQDTTPYLSNPDKILQEVVAEALVGDLLEVKPNGEFGVVAQMRANSRPLDSLLRRISDSDTVNNSTILQQALLASGATIDAETGRVSGSGLFSKGISGEAKWRLDKIVEAYHKLNDEEKGTRLSPSEIKDVPATYSVQEVLTNPALRGLFEDKIVKDKATGKERLMTEKEDAAANEAFSDALRGELDKVADLNPDYVRKRTTADGRTLYTGKVIPPQVIEALRAQNKWPAKQLQMLELISKGLVDAEGNEIAMTYNPPSSRGSREYKTRGVTNRTETPMSIVISKDNHVLVNTISQARVLRNLEWASQKGLLAPWNGDLRAAKSDLFKYVENLDNGLPGITGIDEAKKSVLNAMFGRLTNEQANKNPVVGSFSLKQGRTMGVVQSRRLDRLMDMQPLDSRFAAVYDGVTEYRRPELTVEGEGTTPAADAKGTEDNGLRGDAAQRGASTDSAGRVAEAPQLAGARLPHTTSYDIVPLEHYSPNAGLSVVDTSKFGKGHATRIDLRGEPKSFFFVDGSPKGQDEGLVNAPGKFRYTAEVDGARIYDANADVLGYRRIVNRAEADELLQKKGYAGGMIERSDGAQVVWLYEPVKVERDRPKPQGDVLMRPEGTRTKKDVEESIRKWGLSDAEAAAFREFHDMQRSIDKDTMAMEIIADKEGRPTFSVDDEEGTVSLKTKAVQYDLIQAPEVRQIRDRYEKKFEERLAALEAERKAAPRESRAAIDTKIAKLKDQWGQDGQNRWVEEGTDLLSKKIVDEYKKAIVEPEVEAGKGWYSKMRSWLQDRFGAGIEVFSQLLGATSARTPVDENFKQALDGLKKFSKGDYDELLQRYDAHIQKVMETYPNDPAAQRRALAEFTDVPLRSNGKKFNANSVKVLQALYGNWIEQTQGPKTPNFSGNLSGRTTEATIDVWAARTARRLLYQGINYNAESGRVSQKANAWRIQPSAETGVEFDRALGSEKGGDFFFAQKAFRKAADQLGIEPDDLQAVMWFHEKNVWDKRGWTKSVGAKKSSFEGEAGKLNTERIQAGVTTFTTPEGFNQDKFNESLASLRKTVADTDGIQYARAQSSKGLYGGFEEPSFDVEAVLQKGADISPIVRHVVSLGESANQYDVFVSKVVAADHPNARPGLELGFKSTENWDFVKALTASLRASGVDGFTVAVDRRNRPIGIRAQYIPEITARWADDPLQHLTPETFEQRAEAWDEKARIAIDSLAKETKDKISYEAHPSFDTRVFGREEYASVDPSWKETDVAREAARRRLALGR